MAFTPMQAPVADGRTGRISPWSDGEFAASVGTISPERGRMFSALDQSELPVSQWSVKGGAPEGEGRGASWDRRLKGGGRGIWPYEQ